MRSGLGTNQLTAYLVEMAVRLVELCRVLRPTGSLYLHCDPTASHHLKLLCDATFGPTRCCRHDSMGMNRLVMAVLIGDVDSGCCAAR